MERIELFPLNIEINIQGKDSKLEMCEVISCGETKDKIFKGAIPSLIGDIKKRVPIVRVLYINTLEMKIKDITDKFEG